MSFILGKNKGKTSTGDPLFEMTDAAGKTHLVALFRQSSVLTFRYYLKSEIVKRTPVNGVYPGVLAWVGGLTNDLTVDAAVVTALTGSGDPDGVALPYQGGLVSAYFPAITNLNWIPTSAAVDTITVDTINASTNTGGTGGQTGKTKMTETVTANPDGTITVSGIKVGDKVSIDGGTAIVATDTSLTSAKLTDGSHKVIVTAVSTGTHYYDSAGTTVTTKVEFLSAPLDWFTQNPILGVGVVIGLIVLFVYVILPAINGEPILGGMLDGKGSKKSAKSPKRRFINV